jgi:hypothetical protein
MQIFIDESGSFIPGVGSRISCGAALVVTEGNAPGLFKYFGQLIARWDEASGGETKGSSLDEVQMAAVMELAAHYDPLLVICAIDAGTHDDNEIRRMIAIQAEKITGSLTEQHHPNLVRQLREIRVEWERLPPQLAVQAFTFFLLVEAVLRDASLYFVQREPASLGQWSWTIDAKDPTRVTRYETVWSQLLMPYLQASFFEQPLDALHGADYSGWERMRFKDADGVAWLDGAPPGANAFDLRKVMAELRFEPSAELGLRLIDMLAAAFRRGVEGNLRPFGWANLGRLIIFRRPPVRCVTLSAEPGPDVLLQHEHLENVLATIAERCKPMLLPDRSR